MKYKGRLYGKVFKSYFPLEATTEDWEALEKKVAELEAENKALRQMLPPNPITDKEYKNLIKALYPKT